MGDVIAGTYQVSRLVGRGGMGEVWAATHARLPGKTVAIKVLLSHGPKPNEESLRRFQREAEIAAKLNHPNIVSVHDYNTLPTGEPYLVLEYLEGQSLAARLRERRLTVDETKAVVRQVGAALYAAHRSGVIHRDLKPDNIFLAHTAVGEQVKVLDFGISKIQGSQSVQTQDAALMGTPQYMSPEQALGNNKQVGPAADLFALGAIVYEMLVGRPLFSGDNLAQLVFRIAYEPHQPVATVAPELPAAMAQALEKALVKDPAQRCADIATFVAEFTGEPLTLRDEPLPRSIDAAASSGVATPEMAPSNSLLFGETSAQRPASQHPLREVPVSAPPGQRRLALAVGLVVGAALAAGVWFVGVAGRQAPAAAGALADDSSPAAGASARADSVSAQPSREGAPVVDSAGAVSDSGYAGSTNPLEAATQLPLPSGAPPPPAVGVGVQNGAQPRPTPIHAVRASNSRMSDSDQRVVSTIEDIYRSGDHARAYAKAVPAVADVETGAARDKLYRLATQAACDLRKLGEARARFAKIESAVERRAAGEHCRSIGYELK